MEKTSETIFEKQNDYLNIINTILTSYNVIKNSGKDDTDDIEKIITEEMMGTFISHFKSDPINLSNLISFNQLSGSFQFDGEFNKEYQYKYFLMYIFFRFLVLLKDKKDIELISLVNKLLCKLSWKEFNIEHIKIIAKFYLVLALKRDSLDIKKQNYLIRHVNFIELSISLMTNVFSIKESLTTEDVEELCDYLNYFVEIILKKNVNKMLLADKLTIFPFMTLIRKINESPQVTHGLFQLILSINIEIFGFRFKKTLMEGMINDFKEVLINYDTKDNLQSLLSNLNMSNIHIKYLSTCNEMEFDVKSKDPYRFQSSLIFNHFHPNGFKINHLNSKRQTVVFGIKQIDQLIKNNMTIGLLSFYNFEHAEKDSALYSLVIEKQNLILKQFYPKPEKLNQYPLGEIKLLQSYIFILQIEKFSKTNINKNTQEKFNVLFTFSSNHSKDIITQELYFPWTDSYQLDWCFGISLKEKMSLKMKNNDQDAFDFKKVHKFIGEFGPIIVFSDLLSKKQEDLIRMLKGDYYQFLIDKRYEYNFNTKYYDSQINILFNDNSDFTNNTSNMIEKVYCFIHPLCFQYQNDQRSYLSSGSLYINWDILHLFQEENINFKIQLLAPLSSPFISQMNSTLLQFIKYEGLTYLQLHLEYYYQLLLLNQFPIEKINEIITQLLVNVTNIARTILMCLNQCTLEDIYSNLMPLFHLLSIIFEKFADYKKLSLKTGISDIINILLLIHSQIQMYIMNSNDDNSLKCIKDKFDIVNWSSQFSINNPLIKGLKRLLTLRSQVVSMLLNYKLYDLTDNETLQALFNNFEKVLQIHPETKIYNNKIFEKILQFSVILDINESNVIMNEIEKEESKSHFVSFDKTNQYNSLLNAFFNFSQNESFVNQLIEYIQTIKYDSRACQHFIEYICFNNFILSHVDDFTILNQILDQIIIHSQSIDQKYFISSLLLYFNVNLNIPKHKKGIKIIDDSIMSFHYSDMVFKSAFVALYEDQIDIKEKIDIVLKNKSFPKMENRFQYQKQDGIDFFWASTLYLNQQNNKIEDVTKLLDIIIQFLSKVVELSSESDFYCDFFFNGRNRMFENILKCFTASKKQLSKFSNPNTQNVDKLEKVLTKQKDLFIKLMFDLYEKLIINHPDSFIFEFLSTLSKREDLYQFVIESLGCIICKIMESYSNNPKNESVFYSNIANMIMLFNKVMIPKNKRISTNSQLFDFLNQIIKVAESKNLLFISNAFENKLLSQIVLEIYMYLIKEIFNIVEFLDKRRTAINTIKKLFIKMKGESVFKWIDNGHYDSKINTANPSRSSIEVYFKQPIIKCNFTIYFIEIIIKEYIAQTKEKSINKNDDEYSALLFLLGKIIYQDILNLYSNKEIQKRVIVEQSFEDEDYAIIKKYCSRKQQTSFDGLVSFFDSPTKKELVNSPNFFGMSNVAKKEYRSQTLVMSNYSKLTLFNNQDKYENRPNIKTQIKDKEFIDFQHVLFNGLILNPKNFFFLNKFSIYFQDIFFHNEAFVQMKDYFIAHHPINPSTKVLNYPSKRKQFTSGLNPPLFLKQDNKFFTSEFFYISHPYYKNKLNEAKLKDKKIHFSKHRICFNENTNTNNKFLCEFINYSISYFGILYLYDQFAIFKTSENEKDIKDYNDESNPKFIFSSLKSDRSKDKKEIVIYYKDIEEICNQRFVQMWQAILISLNNGKSYFFNFFLRDFLLVFQKFFHEKNNTSTNKRKIDYQWRLIFDCNKEFADQMYMIYWMTNKISTYEYLLALNKYSSRSFKDINQYYIFPWILIKYPEKNLIKELIFDETIRNFSRPFSLQNEAKYNKQLFTEPTYEIYFNQMKFGGHYSTGAFIVYYLMRMNPFMIEMIKLQNMSYENPNRMFNSFNEIINILFTSDDNRELIPEFFSSFEFMLNLNCNHFGNRIDNQVDDLLFFSNDLSEYAQSSILFWKYLNKAVITQKIHLWIDLVFGPEQYDKDKDPNNQINQFYDEVQSIEHNLKAKSKSKNKHDTDLKENTKDKKETTDSEMNSKVNKTCVDGLNKTFIEMKEKELQNLELISEQIQGIINFGQTPSKLFSDHHFPITYINNQINDSCSFDSNGKTKQSLERNYQILNKNIIYYMNVIGDFLIVLNQNKWINIYHINQDFPKKIFELPICSFELFNIIENNYSDAKSSVNHILKEKYSFTVLNTQNDKVSLWIFIFGRYLDNTIKLYQYKSFLEKPAIEVLMEDFVFSLASISSTLFLTGLRNGKMIEWELKDNNHQSHHLELNLKKQVIAHKAEIYAIEVSKALNIVLTAGGDNYVYIRKLYNFELLTVIKTDSCFIVTELKLSPMNYFYALCYNEKKKLSVIKGYSLAGINFATSQYKHYITLYCSSTGNILTNGNHIDNQFEILSPSHLCPIDKICFNKIIVNTWFHLYENNVIFIDQKCNIKIYIMKEKEIARFNQ